MWEWCYNSRTCQRYLSIFAVPLPMLKIVVPPAMSKMFLFFSVLNMVHLLWKGQDIIWVCFLPMLSFMIFSRGLDVAYTSGKESRKMLGCVMRLCIHSCFSLPNMFGVDRLKKKKKSSVISSLNHFWQWQKQVSMSMIFLAFSVSARALQVLWGKVSCDEVSCKSMHPETWLHLTRCKHVCAFGKMT